MKTRKALIITIAILLILAVATLAVTFLLASLSSMFGDMPGWMRDAVKQYTDGLTKLVPTFGLEKLTAVLMLLTYGLPTLLLLAAFVLLLSSKRYSKRIYIPAGVLTIIGVLLLSVFAIWFAPTLFGDGQIIAQVVFALVAALFLALTITVFALKDSKRVKATAQTAETKNVEEVAPIEQAEQTEQTIEYVDELPVDSYSTDFDEEDLEELDENEDDDEDDDDEMEDESDEQESSVTVEREQAEVNEQLLQDVYTLMSDYTRAEQVASEEQATNDVTEEATNQQEPTVEEPQQTVAEQSYEVEEQPIVDEQQTEEPVYVPENGATIREIVDSTYGKSTEEIDPATVSKMSKLRRLYEMGVITQEEYVALIRKFIE